MEYTSICLPLLTLFLSELNHLATFDSFSPSCSTSTRKVAFVGYAFSAKLFFKTDLWKSVNLQNDLVWTGPTCTKIDTSYHFLYNNINLFKAWHVYCFGTFWINEVNKTLSSTKNLKTLTKISIKWLGQFTNFNHCLHSCFLIHKAIPI